MEKIPQILMDEKVREVLKKAIEAHQRALRNTATAT
jgi:hypothetical protein